MTKRVPRPAALGLFDTAPQELGSSPAGSLPNMSPAPVRMPVPGLPPELQSSCVRLIAFCLERDITRLQVDLDHTPMTWAEHDHQVIEANADLVATMKSVLIFLPSRLQPLVTRFLDLRARVVLRPLEEVPVNGAGVEED